VVQGCCSVALARRLAGSKYAIAVGALSLAVAVGTTVASAAARVKPIATVRVGSQSGMVLSAAGSIWSSDGTTPNGVVYAFGSIWVADLGQGTVVRINPRTNRVTKRIKVAKADWITPSPDALWVSSERGEVVRLDPARGVILSKVNVGTNPLGSAWIGGELWVPNIDAGTISVIDPERTRCERRSRSAAGRSQLPRAAVMSGSRTRTTVCCGVSAPPSRERLSATAAPA
jgi:DNA-binding beta-propeller fold protein YncE